MVTYSQNGTFWCYCNLCSSAQALLSGNMETLTPSMCLSVMAITLSDWVCVLGMTFDHIKCLRLCKPDIVRLTLSMCPGLWGWWWRWRYHFLFNICQGTIDSEGKSSVPAFQYQSISWNLHYKLCIWYSPLMQSLLVIFLNNNNNSYCTKILGNQAQLDPRINKQFQLQG